MADTDFCLVKVECSTEWNKILDDIMTGMSVALPDPVMIKRNHFHCTLIYSRGYTSTPTTRKDGVYVGVVKGIAKMSDGKAVAALIEGMALVERNKELMEQVGGKEDYNYTPHVTLGYQDDPLSSEQHRHLQEALIGSMIQFEGEVCKCG